MDLNMLWIGIGIVLMPTRISLSVLMPIQIRIRVLPQVLHMLENKKIYSHFFHISDFLFYIVYLFYQRHKKSV